MFFRLGIHLPLVFCGVATSAVAAESAFDPVLVTANRYQETAAEALASTTIINREDIEASSATSLEEMLRGVQGLDVRSNSAFGKSTSIFIRGTNSSHVLTLIDGVKIYSATGGGTAFQHLPLSQIERIEIVRGPRSGLYGSEAIGGVIQIFTRKGTQKPVAEFTLSEGDFNTSIVSAGYRNTTGDFSYSFHASQFDTDGIDARVHTGANDNDGYDNKSFSTNLGYKFSDLVNLDLNFLNSQGQTLFDNCFNSSFISSDNCFSDFENQAASVSLDIASQGIWDTSIRIGGSRDLNDNFWEDTANNTFLTRHNSVSWQNNFQVSESQLIIAGVDRSEDEVEATPYIDFDDTRDNTGVFTSIEQKFERVKLKLALRNDDNEQFGDQSTGSIAAGYQAANALSLFASYGTAFKAPTFNELYFPFFGSPDLRPEESESVEIGLSKKQNWGDWSVNVYTTTVDNLIAFDVAAMTANNISKADIQGIEVSINTDLAGWSTGLSVSYVEPLNKDDANRDNILPARSKQSISLNAGGRVGKAGIGLQLLYQGERFSDVANTVELDSYTLVNAKLRYQAEKNLSLEAALNNIFDEDYEISEDYNNPGRNVLLSLSYRLQ